MIIGNNQQSITFGLDGKQRRSITLAALGAQEATGPNELIARTPSRLTEINFSPLADWLSPIGSQRGLCGSSMFSCRFESGNRENQPNDRRRFNLSSCCGSISSLLFIDWKTLRSLGFQVAREFRCSRRFRFDWTEKVSWADVAEEEAALAG